MSRTKTLCKAAFSVVLGLGWPGCPAVCVGMSRGQKKLYARELWAEVLFPSFSFATASPFSETARLLSFLFKDFEGLAWSEYACLFGGLASLPKKKKKEK